MALAKLDKWKMLGISEAIRASKYEMPINPSLLTSLLCFWSPATNTFSFPEGYMTPTVFDIFALLSLCPIGLMAHPSMAVGTGPKDDFLKGMPLSYNEFIKHVKGAGASPCRHRWKNSLLLSFFLDTDPYLASVVCDLYLFSISRYELCVCGNMCTCVRVSTNLESPPTMGNFKV